MNSDGLTFEDMRQLTDRQTAHILRQHAIIDLQRSEIGELRALVASLTTELVDTRGAWDYAEERAADGVQRAAEANNFAIRAGALIDQQQAHIEVLERKLIILLEALDEQEYALEQAGKCLAGSVETHLIAN
jgi:hypothetical protein